MLIDAGLSARQIEQRLLQLGIDPHSIQGILVTHEHSDHIAGLRVFSQRYRTVVYATEGTAEHLHGVTTAEVISAGREFSIGGCTLHPFRITHDASDPVGFVVRSEGLVLGHVTDLGKVTSLVRQAIDGVHSLVIEANHDPDMLGICDYPWSLKQRIASTHGHLSNAAMGELLSELDHGQISHCVLGHLSENSNTTQLALSAAHAVMDFEHHGKVVCANPYHATPLFTVGEEESVPTVAY